MKNCSYIIFENNFLKLQTETKKESWLTSFFVASHTKVEVFIYLLENYDSTQKSVEEFFVALY